MQKKRILVAALNWGLGHAARCIPIIYELQKQGAEVVIGSDNEALCMLQMEFPALETIALPAYDVRYKYSNMFLNIAPQVPKLLRMLFLERRFLNRIIKSIKIDALISDNRYGLYSKSIPTAFLTHQLNIQIPNPLVSAWINAMNQHYMQQYSFVWVPDLAGADNLSGTLGHGLSLPTIRYIGSLSRLQNDVQPISDYDMVAILSGPEPQRSYFEEKLKEQMLALPLKSILVQGRPERENSLQVEGPLTILPFANSNTVAALMQHAKLFIARSGYSSLMDISKMGVKPLLLVPTPGQTEQVYLARQLAAKGAVMYQEQSRLDLHAAWLGRNSTLGIGDSDNASFLEIAIAELLSSVKKS